MKYAIILIIVCVGCKVGPTVIQKDAADGTRFYFAKSGKSKGGGPVVTSIIVRDKKSGAIIPAAGAHFAGKSFTQQIITGLSGMPVAAVNNIGAGYFIGRGLRDSGDNFNNSQSTNSSAGASTIQLQSQNQSQLQLQSQLQGQH